VVSEHVPQELPADAFIRLPTVVVWTGLKRATIYEQIKSGRFPASVKITECAAGWRVGEIRAWLADPQGWRESAIP
jgi:prophage regulatory protein